MRKHVDFEISGFRELAQAPRVAPSYATAVLQFEPFAYWRLGETEGLTAWDSGSSGFHGEYRNGVALGQTGAIY